jgi:hypothetical protein
MYKTLTDRSGFFLISGNTQKIKNAAEIQQRIL